MLTTKDFIAKCKAQENVTKYYVNFDHATKKACDLPENGRDDYYDALLREPKTKSARLAITLGPVVKRHERHVKKPLRFKNRKNYQSLLTNEQVEIKPRETISVLSNEYLQLDSVTAGIILPRLSLTDIGLTLVSTYIDPHWKGILQMAIVNNTSKSINLSLGEAIGVLFVFELSSEIDERLRDNHSNTSHHYGMNWKKIIETEEEPIPTKKQAEARTTFGSIENWLTENQNKLYKAVGSVSILVFIYFLAGVAQDISNFKSDLKSVSEVAQKNQDKLSTSIFTGSQEISLDENQTAATVKVKINQKVRSNPVILIDSNHTTTGLVIAGNITSKVDQTAKEITFTVLSNNPQPSAQSFQFKWILIP